VPPVLVKWGFHVRRLEREAALGLPSQAQSRTGTSDVPHFGESRHCNDESCGQTGRFACCACRVSISTCAPTCWSFDLIAESGFRRACEACPSRPRKPVGAGDNAIRHTIGNHGVSRIYRPSTDYKSASAIRLELLGRGSGLTARRHPGLCHCIAFRTRRRCAALLVTRHIRFRRIPLARAHVCLSGRAVMTRYPVSSTLAQFTAARLTAT
jgi:hypothetical protein